MVDAGRNSAIRRSSMNTSSWPNSVPRRAPSMLGALDGLWLTCLRLCSRLFLHVLLRELTTHNAHPPTAPITARRLSSIVRCLENRQRERPWHV